MKISIIVLALIATTAGAQSIPNLPGAFWCREASFEVTFWGGERHRELPGDFVIFDGTVHGDRLRFLVGQYRYEARLADMTIDPRESAAWHAAVFNPAAPSATTLWDAVAGAAGLERYPRETDVIVRHIADCGLVSGNDVTRLSSPEVMTIMERYTALTHP